MALDLSELATMDATGQAELVRRRELTPLELVDAAITRIESVNPAINAVITPLFDEARAAAISRELPAGPFRGVPFLLKDIGAMQKEQPYYMGNRALRDAGYRSPSDTVLGARFRSAGFITLGKTNTPEFGAQCTTQPLAFGPTRNPWDLERSTSGSSGGSCAAVAAGIVPVAHANDQGGSIRLPAGWCGLVGLKPSRGRVSWHSTSRSIVEFVVSRTVRDVAAVLDAVQGSEPGDLYLIPAPARRYSEELGTDPGKLRIGMLSSNPFWKVHPQCVSAVAATARLLESLGHRVEESFPQALFDAEQGPRLQPLGLPGWRAFIQMLGYLLNRPVTQEDVEPYLWSLSRPDQPAVPAEDYIRAIEWQNFWAIRVAQWWTTGFDLLLTPTDSEPPAILADLTPPQDKPWKLLPKIGQHLFFTSPFNVTGQPAISLPLHWTPEGLPVGVQLVGAIGREDQLIRVARQLEQAQPWIERRPRVHA